MHGVGSAKVLQKYLFLAKAAISGASNLGQNPYAYMHICAHVCVCVYKYMEHSYFAICIYTYVSISAWIRVNAYLGLSI